MTIAVNPAPGFQRHPTHEIAVEPFEGTVTVSLSDTVLASSDEALVLREASYPPVFYIPFKHIRFAFLSRSDTSTECPFKGTASYWNAVPAGDDARDVMWAYENPYDEMTIIRDHGAFYRDKVRIEASAPDAARQGS